ncbi:MAG: cytochrome c [Deltaproteobacteria bacterium]|nr:cytochrome c [Deltaproteobacteria bacterium]
MRSLKLGTILVAVLFSVGVFLAPSLATSAAAEVSEATKAVYLDKCAKCHGDTGKGDGKKAKTLKKKPRDYTDKAKMSELTDEDLVKSITEGKKPMPSYGKGKNMLTAEEITALVAYIRTFAP